MSLGLGIVGAGGVARFHADGIRGADLRVAGVCDVDGQRARTLAAELGDAFATTSLDELLARDDVEAVIVAVPNTLHKRVAVAAMEAGKDVLVEKPMAVTAAECDEIEAAARRTGRIVQVGFVCRCAPAARAARRLVEAGALGRVYLVRASLHRRRGIPGLGRWFTTRAMSGGGVLMDLGVHLIDLASWLVGFPRARRAVAACFSTFGDPIAGYRFEEMWGGPPEPAGVFDVEDGVTALVRYEGGPALQLETAWAANLPADATRDGVLLLGDRGGCVLDLWGNELVLTREHDGRLADERQDLPEVDAWADAWREQAERFRASVRDRTPPEASAAHGRAVQAVIEALYRSGAEGREVEVEPA